MSSTQIPSRSKQPSPGSHTGPNFSTAQSVPARPSKLAIPSRRIVTARAEDAATKASRDQGGPQPRRQPATPSSAPLETSRLPKTKTVTKATILDYPDPKPQFTTFQQHYSPLKAAQAKASFSSRGDTATHDAESADDPFGGQLRDEYLQLLLTYEQSQGMGRRHRKQLADRMRGQYALVKQREAEIRELEKAFQSRTNAAAVSGWMDYRTSGESPARTQSFSHCIQRLHLLSNQNSSLTSLLRDFEIWHQAISAISPSTERSDAANLSSLALLQNMDTLWEKEISSFEEELTSIVETLEHLGNLPDGSALHAVMRAHSDLASVLLSEVRTCLLTYRKMRDLKKESTESLLSQILLSISEHSTPEGKQNQAVKRSWDP